MAYTPESLDKLAKHAMENGWTLEDGLTRIDAEDQPYYRKTWESLNRPTGWGDALKKGGQKTLDYLGNKATQAPMDIARGLTTDLDETVAGVGKAVKGVAGAVADIFAGAKDPAGILPQLVEELKRPPSEEMMGIRQELEAAQQGGGNEEAIAQIQRRLEVAEDENRPISMTVGRAVKKEILYFLFPEEIKNKIANQPHEVLSDIATTISAAASGGVSALGTKAPTTQKVLGGIKKAADIVDPYNAPQNVAKGLQGGAKRIAAGPDVGMTNQPRTFQHGRDTATGQPMTGEMRPVQAADEFGAGAENTPGYVLNPQESMEAFEFNALKKEGPVGQRAQARAAGTADAIQKSQQKMIDDLRKGDNPYEIEATGQRAAELYNERQAQDRLNLNELFASANASFDEQVPSDFNLADKLSGLVKKHKGTGAVDVDVEAATNILGKEIKKLLDKGVNLNDLSLQDLDVIRQNLRKELKTFGVQQARPIGSGNKGQVIYNDFTDLFYDAIEDTVVASNGRLPINLADEVKAAKLERARIAQLEDTPGGKHLISNLNKPANIINGLVNPNGLATAEIKNFYEVLGGNQGDLQAGIMNAVFTKSTNGALGLKRQLERINSNDPNRLIELFGGGAKGERVSKKLHEFSEFWAATNPSGRLRANSPTALAMQNMYAEAAIDKLIDISWMVQASQGSWWSKLAIAKIGIDWLGSKMRYTEYNRIRRIFGHDMPKWADETLKLMVESTKRKYIKPLEVGSRVMSDEEVQDIEMMGPIDKMQGYNYKPRPVQ